MFVNNHAFRFIFNQYQLSATIVEIICSKHSFECYSTSVGNNDEKVDYKVRTSVHFSRVDHYQNYSERNIQIIFNVLCHNNSLHSAPKLLVLTFSPLLLITPSISGIICSMHRPSLLLSMSLIMTYNDSVCFGCPINIVEATL